MAGKKGIRIKQLANGALLLALVASGLVRAEIYTWKDENGVVHFSDVPPRKQKAEVIEPPKISTYESVSFDTSDSAAGAEVVMYSASWCGVCKKARKYFQANNIPFKEYDIEKNSRAKAEYRKLNAKGVPVILVGDKRMNGFSAKGFEKLYR